MRISNDEIAAKVIRATNREQPADATLREVLKTYRDLAPFDAREISQTVFRHYRWLGWTREERTLETKLRSARRLEERFRANPTSFAGVELRKAVPEWVLAEMDVGDEWLRSLQREPKLWLRAKKGQGTQLLERLFEAQRHPQLPDALWFEGETDLFKTPEFHEGQFEIQDIASQLVSLICDPKPGETWWDACAGEGGKLVHLSDLMQNKGLIWASDRAAWRLQKLKRRTARAKVFNYRAAPWNGAARLPTKTKFDGVLLDAPCSGVGTWQRNPHARWTADLKDVHELAAVQKELLANVASSVKIGGKLIYSVCTLTRAETTAVVDAFTVAHSEFESVPISLERLGLEKDVIAPATNGGTLRAERLEGNGMFVAVWRRKN